MKLTKKQSEIVETLRKLEKENNCTIYLKYNNFSKKIHPIKIDSIEHAKMNFTQFPPICTYRVWETMESKGILVPELIYKGDYANHDLNLCKLAI